MASFDRMIMHPNTATAEVHRACPRCGKKQMLVCSTDQAQDLRDYCSGKNRKLIQEILPEDQFTPTEREMIQTGLCDDCYDQVCSDL